MKTKYPKCSDHYDRIVEYNLVNPINENKNNTYKQIKKEDKESLKSTFNFLFLFALLASFFTMYMMFKNVEQRIDTHEKSKVKELILERETVRRV